MKPSIGLLLSASLFAISTAPAQERDAASPAARPEQPDRAQVDRPLRRARGDRQGPALPARDAGPQRVARPLPQTERMLQNAERERKVVMERVERLEQALRQRDERIRNGAKELHARLERVEAAIKAQWPQPEDRELTPDQRRMAEQAEHQMQQARAMQADVEKRSRELSEMAEKLERRADEMEKVKRELGQKMEYFRQANQKLEARARELEVRENRLREVGKAAPRERHPEGGRKVEETPRSGAEGRE